MSRENDDRLTNEFNRRLGRRSERARKSNRPRSNASKRVASSQSVRQGKRGTAARVRLGTQRVPTEVKKDFQRQFGGGPQGRAATRSFQQTLHNIVDESIRDLKEREFTEKAIERAMAVTTNPKDGDSPGLLDRGLAAMKGIPGVGAFLGGRGSIGDAIEQVKDVNDPAEEETPYWKGLMEDFSRAPVGRALDIVSRPMYGVAEGLQTALEADYSSREEGQKQNNPLRFVDDFFKGAAAGVSGKEKTGAGDVWRTMRENSDIVGMEELRELDESHPGVTSWLDRGVGLAGELALDPVNWVSGGSASIIRNTGETLTEQTGRKAVREIAEAAARDFWDDSIAHTGGLRYKPSPDALADYSARAAEDALSKSLLEVRGGTYAGNTRMGSAQFAASVGNKVGETVRQQFFRSFDSRIEKMEKAFNQGGRLSPHSWRSHMAQSPEFEDMITKAYNDYVNVRVARNPSYSPPTMPQWINSLTKADIPRLRKAAESVRAGIDADLIPHVVNKVMENSRDLYYNTVGIRVGKKTIPLKAVGRAYVAAKKGMPERLKAGLDNFAESMSFEHNFPGRLALQTQAGRSIGVKAFENYRDQLIKVARSITSEEDKLIMEALGNAQKAALLPPKLQPIYQMARKDLNDMDIEEIAAGARPANDPYVDDYSFIFNRGGSKDARTQFKNERKRTVHQTARATGGNGNVGKWTLEYAKQQGLNPVDGAMEMLLARKLKSTRDIARSTFLTDLIDAYGFNTKTITHHAELNRKLVPIPEKQLNNTMRAIAAKDGSKFYLPKEHWDLYKKYLETVGWSPTNEGQFIRTVAKTTNLVKYLSTVPRPGFHIRNMLGDLFMGIMDGVPTKAYFEVLQKEEKARHGLPTSFRITPHISLTWDQLKKLYDTHANSGFFDTELPLGGATPSAGQHVNNARKRVANKMREASDAREDYGRIVHFLSALRQESAGLIKSGMKDPNLVLERAIEPSVWRVNKYKFDYGALTAAERKLKLAFPFYTFTRKAAPTLLQQLWMNPKYLGLSGRFMEYNDGSAADNFNHYYLPDYVKDTGYAFLNDEEEPLFMDMGANPVSVLNSLDFTNMQQFSQSVAQQSNPLAQLPFEVGLGKDVFSGRPTGDFQDYLKANFFAEDIAREVMPSGNEDPWWLQLLNEGYMGTNLGVRDFTTEQQDFGFREMEDKFIQDPFSEFNRSQDRYRIFQSNRSDGNSFRLVDTRTDQILGESDNPRELLDRAKSLR